MQEANTHTPKLPTTTEIDDKLELMALFETTKKWFTQNGFEGFLRIAEAPSHEEGKKL